MPTTRPGQARSSRAAEEATMSPTATITGAGTARRGPLAGALIVATLAAGGAVCGVDTEALAATSAPPVATTHTEFPGSGYSGRARDLFCQRTPPPKTRGC
jgi:hypothetical protein